MCNSIAGKRRRSGFLQQQTERITKRMARQISLQRIDTKIEKAKERVLRINASYENALHELDELNTLRREAEEKEIIRAVRRSGKSFQEVMRLIRL